MILGQPLVHRGRQEVRSLSVHGNEAAHREAVLAGCTAAIVWACVAGRQSGKPDRLLARDGDELFDHYRHALEALGQLKGTLGLIFGKAQNKFQDPAKLRRLVMDLIDAENWTALGVDVKGDAYEGLLEKNAQDTKSGAGQYFTPRPLIQAMVDCIAPKPAEKVCDPACGTGGFLFTAYNHIVAAQPNLTREQKRFLKEEAFTGYELVQATARVCAMNLLLHGIGSEKNVPVKVTDALTTDPGERYQVVLANPPFGKK
jgi:type I restriction enzyme M protein